LSFSYLIYSYLSLLLLELCVYYSGFIFVSFFLLGILITSLCLCAVHFFDGVIFYFATHFYLVFMTRLLVLFFFDFMLGEVLLEFFLCFV